MQPYGEISTVTNMSKTITKQVLYIVWGTSYVQIFILQKKTLFIELYKWQFKNVSKQKTLLSPSAENFLIIVFFTWHLEPDLIFSKVVFRQTVN